MRVAALLAVCALAGCVAYEPADVVLLATPQKIKIQWNSYRVTEPEEQAKAQTHCGGHGIELEDAGQDPSGVYKWRTWKCVGVTAAK